METYRYDAFISYRHLSPDKPLAERLQKLLETYIPPRSLYEKGQAPKLRIFRDESELPTSADLGADIRSALENSRFLIVICSKTLEESKWCAEEIAYFKSLHGGTNKNILPLLVETEDGKPVFPETLRFENVTVTDDEGKEEIRRVEIEPLAANVAAPSLKESRKKLKTEFLRIAAPLLGCAFDDLYNRELRRKTRRRVTFLGISAAALAAVALASTAALVTIDAQKRQIEASARELRQNNASLLLRESDLLENKGDHYGALDAAVRSFGDGAEGFQVLNGTLEATADLIGAFSPDIFTAVREITVPEQVTDLQLFAGGTRLLVKTSSGGFLYDVTGPEVRLVSHFSGAELVWFAGKTVKTIGTEKVAKGWLTTIDLGGNDYYAMYRKTAEEETPAAEEMLYLRSGDELRRISPETGETIWSKKTPYCAFARDYPATEEGLLIESGGWGEEAFLLLDHETGSVIARIEKNRIDSANLVVFTQCFYSDGRLFFTNGSVNELRVQIFKRYGSSFTEERTVVLPLQSDLGDLRLITAGDTLYLLNSVYKGMFSHLTVTVISCDLQTGEVNWEHTAESIGKSDLFCGLLSPNDGNRNRNRLLWVAVADCLLVLDAETGAVVKQEKLPSAILDAYFSENGFLFVIDSAGDELFYTIRGLETEDDEVLSLVSNRMHCEISDAAYLNNVYAALGNDSRTVQIFGRRQNPDARLLFTNPDEDSSLYKVRLHPGGEKIAVLTRDSAALVLVDTKTRETLAELPLAEAPKDFYFFGDDFLLVSREETITLMRADGEIERQFSADDYETLYDIINENGKGMLLKEKESETFVLFRPGEKEIPFDFFPEDQEQSVFLRSCYAADSFDLFLCKGDRLFKKDHSYVTFFSVWRPDKNEVTELMLPEDWAIPDPDYVLFDDAGDLLYILGNNDLHTFRLSSGEHLWSARYPYPTEMILAPGGKLCVLDDNRSLCSVHPEDGELVIDKRIEFGDDWSNDCAAIPAGEGRFWLYNNRSGWLIDTDAFEVVYHANYFLTAVPEDQTVYSVYYDRLYTYPIYSPDALRAKAEALIGK